MGVASAADAEDAGVGGRAFGAGAGVELVFVAEGSPRVGVARVVAVELAVEEAVATVERRPRRRGPRSRGRRRDTPMRARSKRSIAWRQPKHVARHAGVSLFTAFRCSCIRS